MTSLTGVDLTGRDGLASVNLEIEKLDLSPGDVLVVSVEPEFDDVFDNDRRLEQIQETIIESLREISSLPDELPIFVLPTSIDLHAFAYGVGIVLIANERIRQVEGEGWTAEHDDAHVNGELVWAAAHYALPEGYEYDYAIQNLWPWIDEGVEWDKKDKHDRIRQLTIAGALIAAEIDRLQRAAAKVTPDVQARITPTGMEALAAYHRGEYVPGLGSKSENESGEETTAAAKE